MARDPETRPGDGPERAPRRASRRLPVLGDLRLDRRLRWIVAVYLAVIAGIVGYNAKAISKERGARLIRLLVGTGDQLMSLPATDPQFQDQLERVRIIGAQVTSVSNDAVGQMTRDTEAAFGRLVGIVIGLGVLGAIAAVAMGLLLRRTGIRRSAQFRSLVHNASDLITVIDVDGAIRYWVTGLSNRGVLRARVDHAMARSARDDSSLTVLLLGLDGFKTVNDSLGHDAGDDLLVAVGARIQSCGRASDTVARLGGDEFAILLEDEGDESRATAVADRVLRELAAPFEVRGREVFVRASI